MHDSSKARMAEFIKEYLGKSGRVLDVGALDICGSYRDLFPAKWGYVGADIVPGKNVDVVVAPSDWPVFGDKTFDAVISGQTFEHIEDDNAVMIEIARVLKPGGYCCIIAPSSGPQHDYPKDYRRYNVELMTALLEGAGLDIVSVRVEPCPVWNDCVGIGRLPE